MEGNRVLYIPTQEGLAELRKDMEAQGLRFPGFACSGAAEPCIVNLDDGEAYDGVAQRAEARGARLIENEIPSDLQGIQSSLRIAIMAALQRNKPKTPDPLEGLPWDDPRMGGPPLWFDSEVE